MDQTICTPGYQLFLIIHKQKRTDNTIHLFFRYASSMSSAGNDGDEAEQGQNSGLHVAAASWSCVASAKLLSGCRPASCSKGTWDRRSRNTDRCGGNARPWRCAGAWYRGGAVADAEAFQSDIESAGFSGRKRFAPHCAGLPASGGVPAKQNNFGRAR